MAGLKSCSTGVLDHLFEYIYEDAATSSLRIIVTTSTGPLELASASSGSYALAISTNAIYPTTGYFTIGTTGTDNRYMTIGACSCDDVIITGNAANVIIFSTAKNQVMYATTCTTQTLTTGNKVNIGSWQITVNQPT